MTSTFGAETVPNEVRDAVFKKLLQESTNKVCADCPVSNPQWASSSFGTFICLNCAANHRNLGTHITFVRAITLDSWTRSQLKTMELGGNLKFMKYSRQHQLHTIADFKERYTSRHSVKYKSDLHQNVQKELLREQEQLAAENPPQQELPQQQQQTTTTTTAETTLPEPTDNFVSEDTAKTATDTTATAPPATIVMPQTTPTIAFSTTKRQPTSTKKGIGAKKVTAEVFQQAVSSATTTTQNPFQPTQQSQQQQQVTANSLFGGGVQPAAEPAPAPAPTPTPAVSAVGNISQKPKAPIIVTAASQKSPWDSLGGFQQQQRQEHATPTGFAAKPVGEDFFSKWTSNTRQ